MMPSLLYDKTLSNFITNSFFIVKTISICVLTTVPLVHFIEFKSPSTYIAMYVEANKDERIR